MKCSVIVATRNHAEFLGRCLRSLFSQESPPEFEIVVVNDASEDSTDAILEAFSSEIMVLTNDHNIGLPASLNLAIEASRGSYIVRVDSDDYVSRHFLQTLCLTLDLNPNLAAVETDYVVFDDFDESNKVITSASTEPIACGIMFRRDAMLDVGLYDADFLLHEDKEFRRRFEAKYMIGHLPIPLYRYRRHSRNITNDRRQMAKFEELLRAKHRRDS